MKKFVIGDIHGGLKALVQVLKKTNFNAEKPKYEIKHANLAFGRA